MTFCCRVQLKILSRHVTNTGNVQYAASLQGPRRGYSGGILTTLQIHLLFATEAVYPGMGVSDENWGEVLW